MVHIVFVRLFSDEMRSYYLCDRKVETWIFLQKRFKQKLLVVPFRFHYFSVFGRGFRLPNFWITLLKWTDWEFLKKKSFYCSFETYFDLIDFYPLCMDYWSPLGRPPYFVVEVDHLVSSFRSLNYVPNSVSTFRRAGLFYFFLILDFFFVLTKWDIKCNKVLHTLVVCRNNCWYSEGRSRFFWGKMETVAYLLC